MRQKQQPWGTWCRSHPLCSGGSWRNTPFHNFASSRAATAMATFPNCFGLWSVFFPLLQLCMTVPGKSQWLFCHSGCNCSESFERTLTTLSHFSLSCLGVRLLRVRSYGCIIIINIEYGGSSQYKLLSNIENVTTQSLICP